MQEPDDKSSMEEYGDEEYRVVSEGVYAYVRWVREEQLTLYGVYLQKIHRLMTVQILLFAGMSYAISQAGWAKGVNLFVLGGIGTIAALLLLRGFLLCIRGLGIGEVSVVGIAKLDEVVKKEETKNLRSADLHGDLSRNIMKTIAEDRTRADARKISGPVIADTTVKGAVLVAVFVVYAIVGGVIV